MGTNSVSTNGKKVIQNNHENTKPQNHKTYVLRQTDDELQSALNGNRRAWEIQDFESSSQLFGNHQATRAQSSSEIFGLEKKSQKQTTAKAQNNNIKLKSHIADVIKDDEDRGESRYTPEQVSDLIVETSKKYDVDPLLVASIAKQETHFTQELSGRNGKGMMQLTSISLKDMYLRSDIYGKEIKPLLDKYGSYDKLLKAVKNNLAVNIEVGTALFRAKLNDAKGNLTKALQNYNGSPLKVSYAKSVQQHYRDMKK